MVSVIKYVYHLDEDLEPEKDKKEGEEKES